MQNKIFINILSSQLLILLGLIMICNSCGVKGKPQAPISPPFIGKGLEKNNE